MKRDELDVPIVGLKHYLTPIQIAHVGGRDPAAFRFVPEPDNPYDRRALAVYCDDQRIGYVGRPYNQALLEELRRLIIHEIRPLLDKDGDPFLSMRVERDERIP
jgi:hypothetical protein